MSEEQLKAFLEKVKDDTALREKIKSVSDVDAVLAIAKETGFAITADDIQSMKSSSELSEDELEKATGGGWSIYKCAPKVNPCQVSCTNNTIF